MTYVYPKDSIPWFDWQWVSPAFSQFRFTGYTYLLGDGHISIQLNRLCFSIRWGQGVCPPWRNLKVPPEDLP